MAKANASEFFNSLAGCAHPPVASVSPFAVTAIFSVYEPGAIRSFVTEGCIERPVLTGTLREEVDLSGILPLFLSSSGISYDYPALVLATPAIGYIVAEAVSNGATVQFAWYQYFDPNFSIVGDLGDGYVTQSSTGAYTNVNGTAPFTYSVLSGTFPPGITLAPDGTWSGNFTTVGVYSWVIKSIDAVGNIATLPDSNNVVDTRVLVQSDLSSYRGPRLSLVSTGATGLPLFLDETVPQYSTEGRLLVETNSSSWGVYDYNPLTGLWAELTITGTKHGSRASISYDGEYVVSVAASGGTLSYYVYQWDGAGYTLINGPYNAAYATGSGPIRFSPDNSKLFHVINLSQVYIHTFAAGVLTIGSGKALGGFNAAWSGDSRYVAVANTNFEPNDGTLTVFDTQGAMPTVGDPIPACSGNRAAVVWKGTTSIYCSGDYNSNTSNFLHLSFDPTGPEVVGRTLVDGTAGPSTLDVSHDGTLLAAQTYDFFETTTYTLDSAGVPTLAQTVASGSTRIAVWVNYDLPGGEID